MTTAKVGLEIGLQNENLEAMKTIFDWLKLQPDFEWVGIKDSSGTFFAQYPERKITEEELKVLNDINRDTVVYSENWKTFVESGKIFIKFSTKNYQAKKTKLLLDMALLTLGILLAASLISFFISIVLTKPIIKLTNIMNQVAQGDMNYREDVGGSRETKILSKSFHFMMDEILAERKKSENLLLNILPKSIADRLKKGEATIADSYDEVSVLFADLVGFTELSAKLSAEELVIMLNKIFSQFDFLCEKYGVEKIKTIGDCYMVASNLPEKSFDSACNLVLMAREMLQILKQVEDEFHYNLNVRIGINTGNVVAGVIGKKKFIYDLWGDSVNLASRMESSGVPGKIQISHSTYELVKDKFHFESRGLIKVKGKGEQAAYLLAE